MKVLVVTGYKSTELGIFDEKNEGIKYIKKAIKQQLEIFIENGLEWILISGQLGVELWTAEIVFEMKKFYSHLKLAVFTPYLSQEENWNELNKEKYQKIISRADHVDSITKIKYSSPQQLTLKNQFLVAKSEGILLLYDEEKEGTPKFILNEAEKKKRKTEYIIQQINFQDLQDMVEEENFNNW